MLSSALTVLYNVFWTKNEGEENEEHYTATAENEAWSFFDGVKVIGCSMKARALQLSAQIVRPKTSNRLTRRLD